MAIEPVSGGDVADDVVNRTEPVVDAANTAIEQRVEAVAVYTGGRDLEMARCANGVDKFPIAAVRLATAREDHRHPVLSLLIGEDRELTIGLRLQLAVGSTDEGVRPICVR